MLLYNVHNDQTYGSRSSIRGLNVPILTPRGDDASVLQTYAGNAFNAVIMPVWDSIKPDRIPTYPSWGESLYNIFIRSCKYFVFLSQQFITACLCVSLQGTTYSAFWSH